MKYKILCVICARGGSKGVKNKNLIRLLGKDIMNYTISEAKKSTLFNKIVFSSDSKKILNKAKKYNIDLLIQRPKYLANDTIAKIHPIIHAVKKSENYFNYKFDYIVDLDLTTPLRIYTDIRNAFKKIIKTKSNNLISVYRSKKNPYFNLIETNKKNKINIVKKKSNKIFASRQSAPYVYALNGSIYIWKRNYLLNKKIVFDENTSIFEMPRSRSIDIDDKMDVKLVEFFLKQRKEYLIQKNFKNVFSLKNKKVFLFGGCGLIGKQIVDLFLKEGANVINFDINLKIGKKLSKKYNSIKFSNEYLDVKDLNNFDDNLNKFTKKYGCPDVFINCTYPTSKDWNSSNFKNNTLDNMREHIDIHLNSYSWSAYKICELMRKNHKKGSVILLSSIYGILGQNLSIYKNTDKRENMNYSIIKGGITNLCKQMASFYGKSNLRINALCPGGIYSANMNKIFIKNYVSQNPLKRLGKPEDVANSALFLASDASSYITGTNFLIDGGWSAI